MQMESREAPAQYRTRMNSKIKGYQQDLANFERDLVSVGHVNKCAASASSQRIPSHGT